MSKLIVVLIALMAIQCAFSKKVLIRRHNANHIDLKGCLVAKCKS